MDTRMHFAVNWNYVYECVKYYNSKWSYKNVDINLCSFRFSRDNILDMLFLRLKLFKC